MNTDYDFTNLSDGEMLWTEFSNAFQTLFSKTIQETEKVVAKTTVEKLFDGNLTVKDAVLSVGSLTFLWIVDNSLPINQDNTLPEKSQPTIIQNQARPKSRRRSKRKSGFFTTQDFFTLKGN